MTLHIRLKDYQCPKCNFQYIPFAKDVTCPGCNFLDKDTNEYHDFIQRLLGSLRGHKMQYGSYTPPVWITSSFAEHIQSLCFKFFDVLDAKPSRDPLSLVGTVIHFEESEAHERKHLEDILRVALDEYKKRNSKIKMYLCSRFYRIMKLFSI